jgi:hypothetical protein
MSLPAKEVAIMKFGFVLPMGDARTAANLACEAEAAGWDGFFVGEAVWHTDPWVALTAAAMTTERIRLGTLVAQLPRVRPWKLASETATLDNLSKGRVILGVGAGVLYYGYQAFKDEITDKRIRAELMDEAIDVLTLLYQGEPFTYNGKHNHVDLTALDKQYYPPRPVQRPRIPIWIMGVWPRMKSMRRVCKCDGLLPTQMLPDGQFVQVKPDDIREMKVYIDANRTLTTPFDIISEGKTLGMDHAQMVDRLSPWVEAGATWWIETLYGAPHDEVVARLRQGPPRLDQ